jgi:hypothetical protein
MELTMIFKNLRDSVSFLAGDYPFHVVKNMIFSMNLNEEDSYTALVAAGFPPQFEFDYEGACYTLGKDTVDEWLDHGNFVDDFHPASRKNLDYLVNPEKRKKFHDEYLQEIQGGLRRTGSICVRLHQNFTIAEIEYEVSIRNKEVDELVAICVA